jgi:hypothetical protein
MSINKFLDQTISIKLIIIGGGFWLIVAAIAVYLFFGGLKEGFDVGLIGLGSAIDYKMSLGSAIDYKMGDGVKKSWENSDTISDHANPSDLNDASNIYSELEKNEGGGPIPLPEDELLFFDSTKFSPECCPSPYSTSEGCVCASPEQMKYLNERGGNRTLTSQY